jgi:RNA polymerase sigma-70 factor (ECF subfamily)
MNKLWAMVKAGDRAAEERLLQYLSARFVAIAKRIVGEKEAAEDIAQDACVTVLQKCKTEDAPDCVEAWAYQVLRMKIGNYLQASRVRRQALDHSPDIEETPEPFSTHPLIDLERKVVDCLKMIMRAHLRYARVLNLSYQGYKAEDICKRLRISTNALYSTLSRSRSMLRKCLETGRI